MEKIVSTLYNNDFVKVVILPSHQFLDVPGYEYYVDEDRKYSSGDNRSYHRQRHRKCISWNKMFIPCIYLHLSHNSQNQLKHVLQSSLQNTSSWSCTVIKKVWKGKFRRIKTTFQGLKMLSICISNLFSPFQTLKEVLSNLTLLQRLEMTIRSGLKKW